VNIDIKAQVTAGPCEFVSARAGNLWYRTALGFEFPVPISEMGEATFSRQEKGIHLMRYIRKHAAMLNQERQRLQIED